MGHRDRARRRDSTTRRSSPAALGIPVVVGLGAALLTVAEGTTLAVDGDAGIVEVDPDAASAAAFEQRRAGGRRAARPRAGARVEPVALADGRRIEVFANIGSAADAGQAVAQGAEGVGLLRTEFLFLDRAEPPERGRAGRGADARSPGASTGAR